MEEKTDESKGKQAGDNKGGILTFIQQGIIVKSKFCVWVRQRDEKEEEKDMHGAIRRGLREYGEE